MHSPRELSASTIHGLARQLIHHQFSLRLRLDDLAELDAERAYLLDDMTRIRHLISGVQHKVNWEMAHHGKLLGDDAPHRAERLPWEDDDEDDDWDGETL